jgi:hypothetical protein
MTRIGRIGMVFLRGLGHAWTSPATLAGILLAKSAGGGRPGYDTPTSEIEFICDWDSWLQRWFESRRFTAITIGACTIYRCGAFFENYALQKHERRHRHQWMVLGFLLFPIAYGLSSLYARLRYRPTPENPRPYYNQNWFERDAERFE